MQLGNACNKPKREPILYMGHVLACYLGKKQCWWYRSAGIQRSNNGKQLDDINLGHAMSGWLWNAINGRVASNLVTCLNCNIARVGNAIAGWQHVMPWKASGGWHRGWQAHSFLGACLEVVSTGSLPSLAALGRTLGSPWPHGGWLCQPSGWNPRPTIHGGAGASTICAGGSFGAIPGL